LLEPFKNKNLTQTELIQGCINQNRSAQEALYTKYKQTLFVLCLKYCANKTDAEDVLHNAFLTVFETIKNYKYQGSFEGWMKKIAINKAINCYKKSLTWVSTEAFNEIEVAVDENEITMGAEEILKIIQELPNQYRLVFSLYELDNYPHKEIAQMLSISESTSKSNLHRAKVLLKEKISEKNSFTKTKLQHGA
jgi:RNA polymerase sigma factor (sigma-70 family)